MECPFSGSLVALPTPFRGDNLDLDALHELIDIHVEHKTAGLVIAGTTGEACTLSERERRTLIHATVEYAAGRIPLIIGVGTNSTRTTVDLARFATACHADGLLVVTPYYNRPSNRGLELHFGAIAQAVGVPIILYNVPSRTGCDLTPDLVRELGRRHENIVAIKQASMDVERARHLCAHSDLAVFCGEDRLMSDFMRCGARGAISVVGNIMPDEVAELLLASAPEGDAVRARELKERLEPVVRDLFIESNPVPIKAALALRHVCAADVRAPLVGLDEQHQQQLESTLRQAGLLSLTASS